MSNRNLKLQLQLRLGLGLGRSSPRRERLAQHLKAKWENEDLQQLVQELKAHVSTTALYSSMYIGELEYSRHLCLAAVNLNLHLSFDFELELEHGPRDMSMSRSWSPQELGCFSKHLCFYFYN